jgi:hypothetical protein
LNGIGRRKKHATPLMTRIPGMMNTNGFMLAA